MYWGACIIGYWVCSDRLSVLLVSSGVRHDETDLMNGNLKATESQVQIDIVRTMMHPHEAQTQ